MAISILNAVIARISQERKRWVVTGAAGFIGSHLTEALLKAGQEVVAVDDFSTGHRENLTAALEASGADQDKLTVQEESICSPEACARACAGADYLIHEAAMASVPKSFENPQLCLDINVKGTINLLEASRKAGVNRVVFASSSAVYGENPNVPLKESDLTEPISPYGLSKLEDEFYARIYAHTYGLSFVALRYFNIYGPRQDPAGPYAAVISKWVEALLGGKHPLVFGDGSNSRDFCFVDDVVQANLLAACTSDEKALNRAYNVGTGRAVSLLELLDTLTAVVRDVAPDLDIKSAQFREARSGDILHSGARIDAITEKLGFSPSTTLEEGLRALVKSLT